MNRQDSHASSEAMRNKTPYVHRIHNNRWVSERCQLIRGLSMLTHKIFLWWLMKLLEIRYKVTLWLLFGY